MAGSSMWRTVAIALLAVASAGFRVAAQAADEPPTSGLVVVDASALRAAPKDAAPLLASLWRGEAVQLREARGDWLQVWDPHRERGGFVRASQLLPIPPGDAAVAELAAQLRLLRQQPGAESLGVGVAAALIERAGGAWLASAQGAEMLETLIVVQERLAQRAQSAVGAQQAAAAAHADVAARYGFALRPLARPDGSQRLCPDFQAARLLRGHPAANASRRARAALALTRTDCPADDRLEARELARAEQRVAWLDGIDASVLPPVERNRLLLRRAGALASLAFARREVDARDAAAAALAAWTQLIPAELTEDDAPAVRVAAIRLSPMRWLLQRTGPTRRLGAFELRLERGGPGQTCLIAERGDSFEPVRRCSHGIVHLASARVAPDGRSLALAVQPLDGWTELWRIDAGGRLQVLPPSAEGPGLGAVEWAGWAASPDGPQILVAREADAGGRVARRFEVYGAEWAEPLRWAGDPGVLGAFQRSADPAWRGATTMLR